MHLLFTAGIQQMQIAFYIGYKLENLI